MTLKEIGTVLALAGAIGIGLYGFTRWRAEAQARVESEKQEAEIQKENDRQNGICKKAVTVFELYRDDPGLANAGHAQDALDGARQAGLSPDRYEALQDYWTDLKWCFLGRKPACKKSGEDYSRLLDVCF